MQYKQARQGYLEWYSHFLSPFEESQGQTLFDPLLERLEGFLLAEETLRELLFAELVHADEARRLAALDALLSLLEAEATLAELIWEFILAPDDKKITAREALRGQRLQKALYRLNLALPAHENVFGERFSYADLQDADRRPAHLEQAVADLRFEVDETLSTLQEETLTGSLRLLRDLLSLHQHEPDAYQQGLDLLRGQMSLGKIAWRLADAFPDEARHLVDSLRSLLVEMMQKVLALIEKNDLVRYTLDDWLKALPRDDFQAASEGLKTRLEQLYQMEHFRRVLLPIWLEDATQISPIHTCADAIMGLGLNFDALATHLKYTALTLSNLTIFRHPTLAGVGAGLQLGLLGTLIFAAYDHLDEGGRALNLASGVKEVLLKGLPVSRQTQERAESIAARRLRL
jgi:hypothetical protein